MTLLQAPHPPQRTVRRADLEPGKVIEVSLTSVEYAQAYSDYIQLFRLYLTALRSLEQHEQLLKRSDVEVSANGSPATIVPPLRSVADLRAVLLHNPVLAPYADRPDLFQGPAHGATWDTVDRLASHNADYVEAHSNMLFNNAGPQVKRAWQQVRTAVPETLPGQMAVKPRPPKEKDTSEEALARRRAAKRRQRKARSDRKAQTAIAASKVATDLAVAQTRLAKAKSRAAKAVKAKAAGKQDTNIPASAEDATPKPNRKARRWAIYGPPKSGSIPLGRLDEMLSGDSDEE